VTAGECRTENSAVLHDGSGKRASYGDLCGKAATMEVDTDIDPRDLKAPKDFRLLGKPLPRLDTPSKVDGTAVFALDVYVPDMLTAVVAHPPTFGGKAKSIDDTATRAVKGVRGVFDVGSGVAVVAENFWAARQGRERLRVEWDLGPNAETSTDALFASYRQLAGSPGLVAKKVGDAEGALGKAARKLEADYELPFLAHAPMEPLNCVVAPRDGGAEVWAGTQFQTVDQASAAAVFGCKPEQVKLHTTFLGGGFGRRANPVSDYIVEACKIARAAKSPIKMVWTREDDMRSGYYRPMWLSRIAASIDAGGVVTGWHHRIVGQSFIAGTSFEPFIIHDGVDHTSVEGADDVPYAIDNLRVELHTTKVPVPTLWWRSVGHSHTAFVVESFFDEIAHAKGIDPVAMRRSMLKGKERHLRVLDLATEKAGYGKKLPAGHAHGAALHFSFRTYVAVVLEVSIENGWPRVHKATCAVDCGRTINPNTVRAQLEGAVGFALTAALYGEISLRDGRVVQSNFHDYRMLRIHEMPAVDVHVVPSEAPSTGVGEPGVPPVAPALGNALFHLTGKRIRRLPVRAEDLR
jgi:isoquinoline 1-oxidoreductase beta subunit